MNTEKKMFGIFAVFVAAVAASIFAMPSLAAPVMDQLRVRDQLKIDDPLMTKEQIQTQDMLQTQEKLQTWDQLRTCTQDCTQLQTMDQIRAMDGSCGECIGTCLNGGVQLRAQSGYRVRICV